MVTQLAIYTGIIIYIVFLHVKNAQLKIKNKELENNVIRKKQTIEKLITSNLVEGDIVMLDDNFKFDYFLSNSNLNDDKYLNQLKKLIEIEDAKILLKGDC